MNQYNQHQVQGQKDITSKLATSALDYTLALKDLNRNCINTYKEFYYCAVDYSNCDVDSVIERGDILANEKKEIEDRLINLNVEIEGIVDTSKKLVN